MNRDWLEGWSGQYRRMLRWRKRLNEVYESDDAEEIYDFSYAFFQNCYHLRDWLISDGRATKREMEDLFASSIELKLCRDICNSAKHLQYDRPSIDPKPRIGREFDSLTRNWHGWYLYSDEIRPVSKLANQCVAAWETFLFRKGLLIMNP